MALNKKGRQSFLLPDSPIITAWASVAGKKEAEGPLGHSFDLTKNDTYFGEKTWEQGERKMQQLALDILVEKAKITPAQLDVVLSGDLLRHPRHQEGIQERHVRQ